MIHFVHPNVFIGEVINADKCSAISNSKCGYRCAQQYGVFPEMLRNNLLPTRLGI